MLHCVQGSKSKQKFFISKDGRYFIKTITKSEAKKLIKVRKLLCPMNLPKCFFANLFNFIGLSGTFPSFLC
jgi:hypothetical protein